MFRSSTRTLFLAAALTAGSIAVPSVTYAQSNAEVAEAARFYIDIHANQWLADPLVIDSIKAQNKLHADVDQAGIDRMDKTWREESKAGSGPMIDRVLGNELSAYLKRIQEESNGLITEIFVMDDKGLNVGQSDVTSDYWQGDEDKWQKTYQQGADAVFVDAVELDESSQRYQTQVSVAIADPATGNVIGAVTIGIDAEGLLMM